MNNFNSLNKFWKNKKVFLTGHTGFKGTWFSILLSLLGAKVIGYSLKPSTSPNLYNLTKLNKLIHKSLYGDIRDYKKLKKSILKFTPDFIVHMAAQPLVRQSYDNPKYTYEVNTLGTINILNILNEINFIKSALIITTDKVYANNDKKRYFKEDDSLGGMDPYSNSKSCAELAVKSYNHSFLKQKKIFVATARAGNVIGGGDFSNDRIIPDYFRSLLKNQKLILRSPNSVRPWQHVLDPLYGYLLLLMKLDKKQIVTGGSFNFGPNRSSNKTVNEVINLINKNFNNEVKIIRKKNNSKIYKESKILMLDSSKSKKILRWNTKYNLKKSIYLTSSWFRLSIYEKNKNILKFTQEQIKEFLN
ncbi:CDP-glucose 4,6-dehydratase [Candidatus Pelagibacter bacterium]|nr:CDP-glucose 4,6-dehydratase [Candidatus Pelagibacter bacterium]MDA8836179.1 CDP-glucose 4,6-dehydratase [Candidatus Pelagibacter bacterium]